MNYNQQSNVFFLFFETVNGILTVFSSIISKKKFQSNEVKRLIFLSPIQRQNSVYEYNMV